MTVAATSTSARNDYTGNGTQTVYSFTFEVLNESNSVTGKNYSLRVILTENSVETEQVEDTDYTVTYNSDTRLGSVTFTTAPSSSQTITLLSDISRTQSTDYISIGTDAFPANSHEGTVDKLTLISRELDEKIDRSILLPESSQLSNVTIPVSTANAGKFITVNGDGDDLTASEIADTGSAVSTFAKTLLDDETAAEARGTLGAEQKASGLTAITSLEDADEFVVVDDSDSDNTKKITLANTQATTSQRGTSILPSRITIANNSTDSDHDIDFTGGTFDFDDGSGQAAASALTKQIDSAWAEGDNAGGLDTGSVAADTTYHLFAIWNPTSQVADYLFSTSIDSPTLPSGYTKQKRIAALCTNGSANIINLIYSFKPDGSYIAQLKTPILDVNASNSQGTTAVNYTLTVPDGLKLKVIVNVAALDGFSNAGVYLSDPDTTNMAPSTSAAPLFTSYDSDGSGSANNIIQASCFTNTSAEIRARADLTLDNFRIATLSFEDFINE